ncbi:uncharacterized protein LOC143451650 isoform X2 [Clavelina lepadiformis]|uniref:uncharacterized protein LOC143451650 isoform X2 n=1 Tax=Clavelina lepadiformis TaxID=159417 RepID=UPI004042F891
MSSGGVMLSGWLRKSPPERKLRRNAWKKRWFVLRSGRLSGDPNVLEYFRHQGSKRPIKAITLDECSQIDANVPIKYDRKDPDHQFVFDIVTKTRTYYLVAESNLEMSSWVRYLCDLCGFNHDTPENQNLGTQQQTFKAVQPISGRNYQNGNAPLLENEDRDGDAPAPLPRPRGTITNRSKIIRRPNTDANDNPTEDEVKQTRSSTASSSGSGQVSVAGPFRQQVSALDEKSSYSYAKDLEAPPSSSDYLLLTDCNTAEAAEEILEDNSLLTVGKFCERRTSTDSVFTHEGTASDNNSDVIIDQPIKVPHMRFVANIRNQRLDSMPDCPPPPPPVNAGGVRPQIRSPEQSGTSFPPDDDEDDDVVTEARTRSYRSSHGLSPIDDSELNRVPLNLQREFHVDDMGNPLLGSHTNSSSNASTHAKPYNRLPSGGNSSATEYINTADASAEAGFGTFANMQRYDAMPQQYEQQCPGTGRSVFSPTNRSASSQVSSSVFFNSPMQAEVKYGSPRNQMSDGPVPSRYLSSPHHQHSYPHQPKGSFYSSSSTLSPYISRGSPARIQSAHMSPAMPKLRRSSSVGQLESVANELAAETNQYRSPSHARRRSIDHRPGQLLYNPSMAQCNNPNLQVAPSPIMTMRKSNTPPPRPPKSESTLKQSMPDKTNHPAVCEQKLNSDKSYPEQDVDPRRSSSGSVSPPHTAVAVPDSPPHALLNHDNGHNQLSPAHSRITHTIPISEANGPKRSVGSQSLSSSDKGSRSVSCSSSSGTGSSSDSTRSRSPAGAVYDISTATIQAQSDPSPENKDGFSNHDTPKPIAGKAAVAESEVTTPNTKSVSESPTNGFCNYDTPSKIPVNGHLAEIQDDAHPNYEMMLDQADMLLPEAFNDPQAYTCMAGANALMNSPAFTMSKSPMPSASRPAAASEPPPVKRDLKPGRKSLGSDSGLSETSKQHHSRSSYEDSPSDANSPVNQPQVVDSPLSPPHATITHTLSSTPVLSNRHFTENLSHGRSQDRLLPPERPPKHSSSSSLSPRTPPSATMANHLPGRPYAMTSAVDRTHKLTFDNQATRSPSLTHTGPRQRTHAPPVPGRPPKPLCMVRGAPPSAGFWDESVFYQQRSMRDFGVNPTRPPKSSMFPDYGGNSTLFFPSKFPVVPPPSMESCERELKYVELKDFPTSDGFTGTQNDSGIGVERPQKAEEGVEYIVLDREKTEALEKMKRAREQELSLQKRGSIDSRAGKR